MKVRPFHLGVFSVILLVGGVIASWISYQPDSPEAIAERVNNRLTRELERVNTELTPLLGKPFEVNTALSTETTYPFFVYNRNHLVYWSDNTFVPPPQVAGDTFSVKLLRIGREAYLLKKDTLDKKPVCGFPYYACPRISHQQ